MSASPYSNFLQRVFSFILPGYVCPVSTNGFIVDQLNVQWSRYQHLRGVIHLGCFSNVGLNIRLIRYEKIKPAWLPLNDEVDNCVESCPGHFQTHGLTYIWCTPISVVICQSKGARLSPIFVDILDGKSVFIDDVCNFFPPASYEYAQREN